MQPTSPAAMSGGAAVKAEDQGMVRAPDHSTFSRNRHGRFRQSDALRRVFEMVVRRKDFAVDAGLIQADANKQRSVPGQ